MACAPTNSGAFPISPAAERLGELASLGGPPAFAEPLHVGRPNIGDRAALLRRIEDMLDRRWLTNGGRFVGEFEQRVAEMHGVRHCLAVTNGTVGLQLAAHALGLTGEVIMPSFTFVGTAHAMAWIGLRPVFVDVGVDTYTIDPACVEAAITPQTSAILGVHLWGRACEVEALEAIADDRGLALLFDAAHALGCSHRGRWVGGFGDAEIMSFHATKVVSAAEGGAVLTDDDELAARMRVMRNFGFVALDQVVSLGTNAKMSELCAAMGLTSLDSFDEFVEANRRNHAAYASEFADVDGVDLIPFDPAEVSNFQYAVAELSPTFVERLPRDDLVAALHAENVLARRYFSPGCHRVEPYATSASALPVTEDLSTRVLALPTGTTVGAAEIAAIAAIVRRAVEEAPRLARAFSR
jgi:dTDP-4-amino-4,6-dideoxygalactose transaminase